MGEAKQRRAAGLMPKKNNPKDLDDLGTYLHLYNTVALPIVCFMPKLGSVHEVEDGTVEVNFTSEIEHGDESIRAMGTLSTKQDIQDVYRSIQPGPNGVRTHGIRMDSVDATFVVGNSGEKYHLIRGVILPLTEILGGVPVHTIAYVDDDDTFYDD